MSSPTRWAGVPLKDRRAERRALLVEAAYRLFGSAGEAAVSVRSVCRECGLNTRYFYESFGDHEALLLAVYEHVLMEGIERVLAGAAGAPHGMRATARAGIAAAVEFLIDDPRKGRVLILEATGNETLQRRRQEAVRAQAALLSEFARDFFGDRVLDPMDANLTALALVGALAEVGAAYLDGGLDISRERLIDHLTELFVASAQVSTAH